MPPLACRDGALCANRGFAGCVYLASLTEGNGGECSMFSVYVRCICVLHASAQLAVRLSRRSREV